MGNSLGNAIFLKDDRDTVHAHVMAMYTDPTRIHATDPGTVEGNPVFIYHDAFNPNREQVESLKIRYREGTVGDVEVKELLSEALNTLLDPIRERRQELALNPDLVDAAVRAGTERARDEAAATMTQVPAQLWAFSPSSKTSDHATIDMNVTDSKRDGWPHPPETRRNNGCQIMEIPARHASRG